MSGTKGVLGYRTLTEPEIEQINDLKAFGEQMGQMVQRVQDTDGVDLRWVAIARTDFQTGLMALIRAIAQPTTF